MNKVAVTYWDNPRATILMPVNARAKITPAKGRRNPQWLAFALLATLTLMLCTAINLRAFAEMSAEVEQNQHLTATVEQLTDGNIGLQTEVHNLKTDRMTLEREARKIGMTRPNEKVLVPVN